MTRLAPAVLICIMALAVLSGIGFALSQSIPQQVDETSEDSMAVNNVWKGWIEKTQLQGDPIGDPRPN